MADRPFDPDAPTWTAVPPSPLAVPAAAVPTWPPAPATIPGPRTTHGSTGTWPGTCDGATAQVAIPRSVLPEGTIVDQHYRIDGVIGAGAMGVVYRAHHLRLDRPVALKLQRTVGEDTARLEREARAMARLDHPNVVRVYDVGMHEGDLYIAMEFVDGVSLRAWLAEGPRPWRAALEVCLQAGRGLMAAHAAGIVHRDFKPDNVLVGRDPISPLGVGRVRVADFGIARGVGVVAPDAALDGAGLGPDLTRTGSVPGTPAYMAPEQFSGRADTRSDVFAFAVVLYEALWGVRPFAGSTLAELIHNVMHARIRPVPESSPVPVAILRAVLGGLAVDARIRTASMALLLGELERGKIPPRSGLAIVGSIAAAALLGAGALGGVAWWATRQDEAVVADDGGQDADTEDAIVREAAMPREPRPIPLAAPAPAAAPRLSAEQARVDAEREAAFAETDAVARVGKQALADLMRGKDVDPAALEGLLEAESADVIAASIAGVMMMDADARADEGGFRRPGWDGTSKLVCKLGDKFRFEGETFVLEGTAFMTMYGCQLQLIDCDITADIIAHVMTRSELTISGGTLRPRSKIVQQLRGAVTVSGIEVIGAPQTGFEILGGTLDLADVSVSAQTAVSASAEAVVTVVGGRLEGSVAAIDVSSRARVGVAGTAVVGVRRTRSGGMILDSAAAPRD